MSTRIGSSEILVNEPVAGVATRVAAATFDVPGIRFRLHATGRSQRIAGRACATRFDGSWETRWRRGRWSVDLMAATDDLTLLSVTVHGRVGPSAETAHRLARALRIVARVPQVGDHVRPSEPTLASARVWETA